LVLPIPKDYMIFTTFLVFIMVFVGFVMLYPFYHVFPSVLTFHVQQYQTYLLTARIESAFGVAIYAEIRYGERRSSYEPHDVSIYQPF